MRAACDSVVCLLFGKITIRESFFVLTFMCGAEAKVNVVPTGIPKDLKVILARCFCSVCIAFFLLG